MPEMPDAIVLCGGSGLRLRSVTGDGPKAMAQIAGRPFLEVLLRQLRRNGFRHAILAVGYRADVIREHFGAESFGLRLTYSAEESPLGTGGAVHKAVELAGSDTVLVMNGDSYTGVDLVWFVSDYHAQNAGISIVAVPVDGRGDCGTVAIGEDGRLTRFAEKQPEAGTGYINAGIYLASRQALSEIPEGREVSLERQVIPQWLAEGRNIRGFVWNGQCVDIGTPERFVGAQELLGDVESEEVAAGGKG